MGTRYFCPVCRGNRTNFEVIHKLAQEVHKDAWTGEDVFVSDELETVMRGSHPDIDVHCLSCGYVGNESLFIKAAERDHEVGPRPL